MLPSFKKLVEDKQKQRMREQAYTLGVEGFRNEEKNPFLRGTAEYREWENGFLDARFIRDLTNGKN